MRRAAARPGRRGPRRWARRRQRLAVGRGLAALQAPPAGLLEPVDPGAAGAGGAARARCSTRSASTTSTSRRGWPARAPRTRWAPTTSAATSWRACSTADASRLAVGLAAMLMAISVGVLIGADRRHRARLGRCRADVADRPVPEPAAAAAAAAADLPVPRPAEEDVRARARHLHPHRRGHRGLPLDAGGAAGARAVLQPAREGVRRGRARAGREPAAAGGAPHPAQQPGPGDRRRHHRRGRGHHRREHAELPGPGLPARHPDLGPHPLRRPRLHGHRHALGAVPGAGDLHHRADDQLHRRRAARRARSAAGACSHGAARHQGPEDPFQDRRRLAACRRRRGHHHRPRRDRRRRRRIGLRQERHRQDGAEADRHAAGQDRCRPGAVEGPRPGAAGSRTRCRRSAPRRSRSSSRSR